MKKWISNYIFNPELGAIVSDEFESLENILMITNVSKNQILYNFADLSKGGNLVEKVLTLTTDCSLMNSTDRIQIFIDIPNPDYNSLNEFLQFGLAEIVHQLQSIRNDGGMADQLGRVRVGLEYAGNATLGALNTLNAFGSEQMTMGGIGLTNLPAKSLRSWINVTWGKNMYTYQIYETENGFGYFIKQEENVIIQQDYHPTKSGFIFMTREEAINEASLVLERMNT